MIQLMKSFPVPCVLYDSRVKTWIGMKNANTHFQEHCAFKVNKMGNQGHIMVDRKSRNLSDPFAFGSGQLRMS